MAGEAGEALDFGPLDEALSDEALFDKIYGAWLGRCAGCLLGKPVEGWTKKDIETYLRAVGAYPLEDFFPPMPPGLCNRDNLPTIREPKALKGSFEHMLRDDDIDYTILGLHILDTYGFDFTTDHIAQEWLARLPYLLTYTAERVAYKNLVNRITPPRSATHQNPYREWIGAQIRADIWGYVNPGQPERAAELAYRDATLSHVKNGVYGEMFVSAMLAAAFKTSSVKEVVEIGLSEIPEKSRLAEAIRNVVRWSQQFPTWQGTWNEIMAAYGHYNWVHTINNASIVIMALLHGEGDFGKSIGIAVMGGLDTDCNGATTGSILGAILGARGLPKSWAEPLNDTVESVVAGYHKVSISELARRTARLAKANLARISTEEQ
ncbi:MAG: ADP-ribosylglycohydrolase family protein [Firmicutes bacterium]|nr:ADP-ribosylglycohydrolase family protein [Bacillota bacterium]